MSPDHLTSQDVNLAPRPTFLFSGRARTPSSLGKRPRTDDSEKPQGGMLAIMESMSAQNGQLLKTVAELTAEVAELRAIIAKMEKAQNKGNAKVAEIKATTKKTFAEVTGLGVPKSADPTAGRQPSQKTVTEV